MLTQPRPLSALARLGDPRDARRVDLTVLLLAAAGIIMWFSAGVPWGLALDDAWIHAAHARSWLEHGELAMELGKPSHAVTSIGWTTLYTAAYALVREPVMAASILALLVHMALTSGIYLLLVRPLGRTPALLGAVTAAWTGPVLWHSVSAMETNLLVALLVWGAWAGAERRWRTLGLLCAAAVTVRLEGGIIGAPLLWGAVVERDRKAALAMLIPAVALAGLVGWTRLRIGAWLPSTMEAKAWGYGVQRGRTLGAVVREAWWLVLMWEDYLPFGLGEYGLGWIGRVTLGAGITGLVFLAWPRPRAGVLWFGLSCAAIFAAYAIALPVQGAAGRYQAFLWLLPALGLGGLAAAAVQLTGRLPDRLLRRALQGGLLLAAALALGHTQENARAWREAYRSNTEHIEEVHGVASRALAVVNRECRYPELVYDIGRIAWDWPDRECGPELVDLAGLQDTAILGELYRGEALDHAVARAGGAFVVVPIHLDGRHACPVLGKEFVLVGPPERKIPVDPDGALTFRDVARPSYVPPPGPAQTLLLNNARALRVFFVTAAGGDPSEQ